MGPKRADNISKGSKISLSGPSVLGITGAGSVPEQETQQFVGKFAADLEQCCREPSLTYPITIPVYIRGNPTQSAQIQSATSQSQQQQQQQQQQSQTVAPSGASVTPSVVAGGLAEEQLSTIGKKTSRARVPSVSQSGILIGITGADSDNRSFSVAGQEQSKVPSPSYKSFHLIPDSEFYRPKLLADSANNETESIDQITALYMRSWKLDQRFIDILKKILPLQEQLHTLDFCYVGLNDKTIYGLVELCQVIKNLNTQLIKFDFYFIIKNISLDGNPIAAECFHLLIEKDDSKISQLSLRYCNITDKGVERIARALGNISRQNWKLLTLNLSGNRIGDIGAQSLAAALRYNRTLISLNLSSNFINDKGALPLALVLRRIVLTPEEIIQRRRIILKRYAETHLDEFRVHTNSPTPSNVSTKSKSGRTSRGDFKRVADPNKRKINTGRTSQNVEKRNRNESDENRPPSENKGDLRRGRNEGSSGRSSVLNASPATGSTSRRTTASTSNASNKDSDQSKTPGPSRIRKVATTANVTTKKNISIVKEEDEDAAEQGRSNDLSLSGKKNKLPEFYSGFFIPQSVLLPIQGNERENPLLETNEFESQDGEMWLRGNFVLLSLNLSRNYLTIDSVREFLLSLEQQSAFTNANDIFNLSSTATAPLMNFSGLCRLELKGMNDISTKSSEYQSIEILLTQKSPLLRFQQLREREPKESFDLQSIQQLQQSISEKTANTLEKPRTGSSSKPTNQRPTSRLKE
ncbi:unnamed protein product [Rotaria socialis]|uniref:Uncharacterized protein n=1 Tax=Rotaria socialis TaxID=392032 RepID=A0A819XSN6_9BILA|nr:unnamed protein product [Rotaria socialis]CAF4387587.1 unnamed protein product [Rotaria socialis]CAF4486859.1 unnamed protein product [Rotaria socialis]